MAPGNSTLTWQGALSFDDGGIDEAHRPERTQLDRDSWIDHRPRWFADEDALFAELLATEDWATPTRVMYDRLVQQPRCSSWRTTDDADMLPSVRDMAGRLGERYGVAFGSVGCNLYRDGGDSVAWHGDRIGRGRHEGPIAIVSLGAPRPFLLRPRGGGPSRKWLLGHGDLLVMGGRCQHDWQHCVPKVARAGARMSVTFRRSRVDGVLI